MPVCFGSSALNMPDMPVCFGSPALNVTDMPVVWVMSSECD